MSRFHRVLAPFLIEAIALAMIVFLPSPALAVTCTEAGDSGNWDVHAEPDLSITNSHGVAGQVNIRSLHLESYGGQHIENLYVWIDYDNFLEYGWHVDRDFTQTSPKAIYNARTYAGSYDDVDMESGDQLIGNHYLWTALQTDGLTWKFKKDSTYYTQTRQPPFAGGKPLAGGEINNQCDDGTSHWWTLQRRDQGTPPTGNWYGWVGTDWVCDQETGYGYTPISSQEFRIDARTDNFTACYL
jgi:hypothetical protein